MQKHEARECTGKGYEVTRTTRQGDQIYRAKGVIASSRLYQEDGLPEVAAAPFALEEYRAGRWGHFASTPKYHDVEMAKSMCAMLPRKFRVVYPARRVAKGNPDYTARGLATGVSYDLDRK